MDFEAERREVAYWIRRLYQLKLTTVSGGNVSRRAGENLFVITPTGVDKGCVRSNQVAVMDDCGHNLTPELKPSSEALMHARLYQRYPFVGAIVHAHPLTACAFAAAETPIDVGMLCETYALLDPPVKVPYMLSGTPELAELVAEYAGRSSSILLQNHAAVTTGANLLQAFARMELLESAARLTLIARQLEGVRHLTGEERASLDRYVGRTQ